MPKARKVLLITMGVVALIALVGSGWVYNVIAQNSLIQNNNEIIALQTSFIQQYGSQAAIKQLVSPSKVYAALWADADGVTHISWNIGGLWLTVYSDNTAQP